MRKSGNLHTVKVFVAHWFLRHSGQYLLNNDNIDLIIRIWNEHVMFKINEKYLLKYTMDLLHQEFHFAKRLRYSHHPI